MNGDLLGEVLALIAHLESCQVEYIIVGGVAMNLHGLTRATQDVDLFIKPDVENIERLKRALKRMWADPHIDELTAEDLMGDYALVRYGPPVESLWVDIMTRLGERFAYEDLDSELIRVEDIEARVATPQTLFRMKRTTLRAIDAIDAERLQRAFQLRDQE